MRRILWLGVALVVWLHCRGTSPCKLAAHWDAPKPHYDYLQYVSLKSDGTGEMVMGEGQLVRSEVSVRYRVKSDRITFSYVRGSRARSRTIRVRIDEGDFVVVEPDYDRERERHFRCRLHFAENPFPPDVMSDDHLDYYGCER